jgi:polysaccharide chain length determinant protein (PEP-CTERM system associated)
MTASSDFDIKKLINVFYVQKGMIITVFLVILSLAAYLALSLPDIYRSSTVIFITPQKLPLSYVPSPVTSSIDQRIRVISQDILSRTRLEKIVQELNLYPQLSKMDARVAKLRRNILIGADAVKDVRGADTFALSFEYTNPEKAMQVASRLGALFIDESSQRGQQQATGTTTFIGVEADRLRKELEGQETEVNLYKALHRFELPEQLDANLRTLEQLRIEVQGNMLRLTSLQERKGSLERQVVEAGGRASVEDRKLQLEDLLTRYSEKHPDVVRLEKEIQSLEAESKKQPQTKGSTSTVRQVRNPVQQMLVRQIEDLNLDINSVRAANELLRSRIASYQTRVEDTPVRAIELAKISRAYEITLKKYQDLQGKSIESQLSENMEKKQKGEQFQLVDRANLPQVPVAPNRLRIFLVGLAAALAGSFGLAFLQETLNTSFKRGDEFRDYTDVPVLATIPAISTRGSILEQRRAQRILVLASGLVLVVGIVSIHLYGTLFF